MDNFLLQAVADLLNLRSQNGHTARTIRWLLLWVFVAGVIVTATLALIIVSVS